LSTLLHATAYVFLHNLLNVIVQIANKMGLQKKIVSYVMALSRKYRLKNFVVLILDTEVSAVPVYRYTLN
jgi:hypothetical protein